MEILKLNLNVLSDGSQEWLQVGGPVCPDNPPYQLIIIQLIQHAQ